MIVCDEELQFAMRNEYYKEGVTLAATDGSVKEDGKMGAAAVAWNNAFPVQVQGVEGPPSSTAAELVGLNLAVTAAERGKPLTILTDSQTSLLNLIANQKREHQFFKRKPATSGKLNRLIANLNAKADDGTALILVKVKSHERGTGLQ